MSDLAGFLSARLDEDYEAARLVVSVKDQAARKRGKPAPRWVPSPEGDGGIWDAAGIRRVGFVWERERDHIIRHDPERVLREVELKRSLLAATDYGGAEMGDAHDAILRHLAAVYDDHPEYRSEWRP
jgi:hypothetical protein